MSVAGAIGIDLGSQTALIGIAKKGGVEVIQNESSQRETTICVGFGDNERFLGEQGYAQLKSNFKNTIVFPNRFLGLTPNSTTLPEEKKWLYSPLVTTEDNRIAFEVRYRGEKRTFLPEQITAMMFQKLQSTYKKHGIGHNDIVLSVPTYYTEQERKAILDAGKIAGINIVKLVNETSAIAMSYGIFRKAELDATPKNVAFIDIGHGSTSVFVAAFTKEKAQILSQVQDRHLGTRDMDWKMMEYYAKLFKDQNDINIMTNAKARLRMLDAIDKQRRVLSANSETSINVDCLAEGIDLSYTVSRDQFETMNADVFAKIRTLLEKVKSETTVELQAIEIVGGGSRIPMIQKIIQEVFGIECSRTLHATEVIARGCAIQAAMLSPLFKVAEYNVEELNYYPIRCSWQFQTKEDAAMSVENDAKNDPAKQTSILFSKGTAYPSVKAITFHEKDAPLIDFKLTYDPIPEGADQLLSHFVVQNQKAKEEKYDVKVRILLNKDGIIECESASLIEEYFEDVVVPKDEKPKEGEGEKKMEAEGKEEEHKKKKKTRTTSLKFSATHLHQLTSQLIQTYIAEEAAMANHDRITHETYDKKNQLEAYIYDMRNKINDVYANYASSNTKTTFLAELQKAETWLYNEGAGTTKEAYQLKVEELRFFGNPIEKRFKEYENLPEVISNTLKILGTFEAVVTSNDDKYSHITSEERKPVLQVIASNKQWLQGITDGLKTANRAEEPPARCQELNDTINNFVNEYTKVINKPKPKPQEPVKEEKKPDDKIPEEAPKKDMDIEKEN
jgi:heat shock protein 4